MRLLCFAGLKGHELRDESFASHAALAPSVPVTAMISTKAQSTSGVFGAFLANLARSIFEMAIPANWRHVVAATEPNSFATLMTIRHRLFTWIMFLAPTFGGCPFSANSTSLKRKTALLTKILAVFGFVFCPVYWLAAFITNIRKMFSKFAVLFKVMNSAKPLGMVWFSTRFTKPWWPMDEGMFLGIPTKLKISDSIIGWILILVMDALLAGQVTTDFLFHQYAMLKDVSTMVACRMFGLVNVNVSISSFVFSLRHGKEYAYV